MAAETGEPFGVVSNPEFLKQGAAIDDFMRPDRVVIGAEDDRAAELMRQLYAPFTRTGAPIQVMDCASAELSKYAANAMLATRVSFMNEIANVCEVVGADVDKVRGVVATDRRIGSSFLFPGIGYGGSCFPKDVHALIRSARGAGYGCRIIEAVEAVNGTQKFRLVDKMRAHFGSLAGRTVGVWVWRSSRAPTTCGRRRRSPRLRGCSMPAHGCRRTTRRRNGPRGRSSGANRVCAAQLRCAGGRRCARYRDRVERVS